MQVIRLNCLAAFVVGALSVSTAGAQNIVFTNSTNSTGSTSGPYTIQLKPGQPVTVAPNGDIRAQCELVDATGRCVGIPLGGGGSAPPPTGAPTVSISHNATDTDPDTAGTQVAVGTSFTISANPSQAQTCLRFANPALGAWDGAVLPGLASGTLSLPSAGSYEISLKCFNDAGAGNATPIVIQAVAGSNPNPNPNPQPGGCSGTNAGVSDTSQHYFPPTNLSIGGAELSFQQLWATAGYEVGSQLVKIEMGGSQYRSFRFNRQMLNAPDDKMFFELKGDTSNTGGARPASIRYAAVSTCNNDLRLGNAASSVPTEQPGCRVFPGEGTFIYLNFGAPLQGACNLDPNTTYYMNVTLEDPRDGFQTGQHCNPGYPGSTCAFRVALFQ